MYRQSEINYEKLTPQCAKNKIGHKMRFKFPNIFNNQKIETKF